MKQHNVMKHLSISEVKTLPSSVKSLLSRLTYAEMKFHIILSYRTFFYILNQFIILTLTINIGLFLLLCYFREAP